MGIAQVSQEQGNVTGIISRIIPFSCVDGPGNRFVVFLQGCNFNCVFCHNPQTIGRCNHCGDCVPGCPSGALSLNNGKVVWDESHCDSCDQCLDICPQSSSPMTRQMTVDQVIAEILPAAPFLTGITVTGGESTMQLKFVIALFSAIKQHSALKHFDCLIDSNGYLSPVNWQKVLPFTDGAMIDLKAFDNTLHKTLTGKGNQRVLETIQFLHQQNKLTEVRLLAIPGKTDTNQEIHAIGRFLKSLGEPVPVRINAFSNKAVSGEARDWDCFPEENIPHFQKRLDACCL